METNELRKAAEMALDALMQRGEHHPKVYQAAEALRQALDDKPAVKSYCGGKPNYCTPEETPEVTGEVPCKTDPDAPHGFNRNASHNLGRYVCECEHWTPVDGVYMSQERVDETAKSEHEPVAWLDSEGRFSYFKHLDSDEPLYLAPLKRDNSSWVGLTDDEIVDLACSVDSYKGLVQAVEAKLKEKNT